MKRSSNILEQLKNFPYFTKEEILQLNPQTGLAPSSINTFIARALKRRKILPIKRGLYVSADFYEGHKNDSAYSFFLANIIRKPSYVSSWTALQYYGLATEGIRTITSVTPKTTRSYETKVGTFTYASISETLFDAFVLKKGSFDFFVATPAKALFDMLYFKTKRFQSIALKDVPGLLEELRIDFDEMDPHEREGFLTLVSEHLRHG